MEIFVLTLVCVTHDKLTLFLMAFCIIRESYEYEMAQCSTKTRLGLYTLTVQSLPISNAIIQSFLMLKKQAKLHLDMTQE
jgi:hypothetical protein